MQPFFVIENVHKNHPNGGGTPLFKQISVEVKPKDVIAIQGPSGQGKSTLLRVLAALDNIQSGRLSLHGRSVESWGPCEWRKQVCYVPQQPAMLPKTVEDNLALVSKLHQRKFDQPLAKRLMDEVGLGDLSWSQNPAELSGGQKQRVQLVRSMLMGSDILLLDEATSALDAQSKQAVESMLMRWKEERGTALVWVTHEQEQAERVANRFWYLENGVLSERVKKDDFTSFSLDQGGVE
nr:ATP-binding cassette domain-containing protein [Paenibacillus anseongense]